jgi:hypothetical protein
VRILQALEGGQKAIASLGRSFFGEQGGKKFCCVA